MTILLFIIADTCYHYPKHWSKQKTIGIKNVNIKNVICYYFDDITKIEDFGFNDILLDEKSYGSILFIIFCTKLWLVQNLCILCFIRWMGLLEIIMRLNI